MSCLRRWQRAGNARTGRGREIARVAMLRDGLIRGCKIGGPDGCVMGRDSAVTFVRRGRCVMECKGQAKSEGTRSEAAGMQGAFCSCT